MKQGDIYEIKLRDGRFGAAKILQTGGKFDFSNYEFYLIGITTYIDAQPPLIEDPRLNDILVREYIYPKGFKVINIYCGSFPKSSKYVGNIPISHEEAKLKIEIGNGMNGGFPSCGEITEYIGYEVLIEWRYKFDNEVFMKEVEISKQETTKSMMELRNRGPKKMLADDKFWKIISLLDLGQQGNDNKVLAHAVKELSKLKVSEIKNFEEALAYKLNQLDKKEIAKNIGEHSYNEEENYISADIFLYARCAVIANGQFFYETVIKDNSKMFKDIDFEPILSLSSNAYELKTGKKWDYETGISYETYSNLKGWE